MHIFAPTVWACTAATVDLEAVRRALQDDSFAQAKMAEAHRGTAATDEFQLRDGLLIHGTQNTFLLWLGVILVHIQKTSCELKSPIKAYSSFFYAYGSGKTELCYFGLVPHTLRFLG
ncbi:Hypothetical predicted protein [Podarcis lilfordi]|uniref:Uncharacterized protein n=1 Tax=Podarcis lilfordi TaxID=74358 RepID=A0AA35NS26_9SAUR|nr:Hypothetical predicted protein [Podarcis lilfordi]